VARYAPGRSDPIALDGKQELLYVASGRGTLHVGGDEHPLEPEMGVYVVSGETYDVENAGPAELVIVAVAAPQTDNRTIDRERRTVRYADQPTLPAGADREFRYLVNQDVGCLDVTQFVASSHRAAHPPTAILTTRSSTSSMEKESFTSAGRRR
jgi:hypothetical protein